MYKYEIAFIKCDTINTTSIIKLITAKSAFFFLLLHSTLSWQTLLSILADILGIHTTLVVLIETLLTDGVVCPVFVLVLVGV